MQRFRGGKAIGRQRLTSCLDDHAEAILTIIEEQNDRTLDKIVAEMHRRRLPGSRTALFRFLGRHGITRKKGPACQ